MACSNHPNKKNAKDIRRSFNNNPFNNSKNKVVTWRNKTTGQINQKIIGGPDRGVHRYYNPTQMRSGTTGFRRGQKM